MKILSIALAFLVFASVPVWADDQKAKTDKEDTQSEKKTSKESTKESVKDADKKSAKDSSDESADEDRPVKKHKRKIHYENLTAEEKEILARGEISTTSYVVGGILGIWPGFGIGHAVQSRYTEKGWIFTVGELGSYALMIAGLVNSVNGTNCSYSNSSSSTCTLSGTGATELTIGALAFVGFKIWEIVDVWVGPPSLNRRYFDLKSRVDDDEAGTHFMLAPIVMYKGAPGLGMQLKF